MFDWIRNVLPGLRAQAVSASYTPNSADTPENERYWRRMGQPRNDLDDIDLDRARRDSIRSFQRDALGRRIVKIKSAFILGSRPPKPAIEVVDDADLQTLAQEKADAFWFDGTNQVHRRMVRWGNTAWTSGELCVTMRTHEGSRFTYIARIDSDDIDQVLVDPYDADLRIGVLRKGVPLGPARLLHPILTREGELPKAIGDAKKAALADLEKRKREGRLSQQDFDRMVVEPVIVVPGVDGKVEARLSVQPALYTDFNAVGGQTRGIGDLYPLLDSLQQYDHISWTGAERAGAQQAYAWNLTVTRSAGWDEKRIKQEAQQVAEVVGTGTGGVYGHTDDVTLEPMSSGAQAGETEIALRVPMKTITIGAGVPPHWLGDSSSTQHTAGETEGPVITSLEQDQWELRMFFCDLLAYVLRQYPELERGIDERRIKCDVDFPTLVSKDTVRESTVLQSEIGTLCVMVDRGWISDDAAQRNAIALAAEYGLDLSLERDGPDPDERAAALGHTSIFRSNPRFELTPPEDTRIAGDGDERGAPRTPKRHPLGVGV